MRTLSRFHFHGMYSTSIANRYFPFYQRDTNFGRRITSNVKLGPKHTNLCITALYDKRMSGIFNHFKISFAFQHNHSFFSLENRRITQTAVRVHQYFGAIRQNNRKCLPPRNTQSVYLNFSLSCFLVFSLHRAITHSF